MEFKALFISVQTTLRSMHMRILQMVQENAYYVKIMHETSKTFLHRNKLIL